VTTTEKIKNVARNNARVENQIGVVHGDAKFYSLSNESTPEEKFRVGLNYLNGNMPRQAEKLIGEAVMSDYLPIRGAYYWILAILSGRTFDHLSEDEFDQLQAASTKAHSAGDELHYYDTESWLSALDVLVGLVGSILSQEQNPDSDSAKFAAAFQRYEQLPKDRKDEIRRHLDMILVGGIQDQIAARDAAEIAEQRMSGDRANRVWRFFVPDPTPPRKIQADGLGFEIADALMLACGLVLTALSIYSAVNILLPRGNTLPLTAAAVFGIAGFALAANYGCTWLKLAAQLRWQESCLRVPERALEGLDLDDADRRSAKRMDFPTGVDKLVDLYFDPREPTDDRESDNWQRDSKGRRESLKREIVEQYKGAYPASANAVEWLILWHARKFYDSWKSGKLFAFREELKASTATISWCAASVVLIFFAWLIIVTQLVAVGGSAGTRTGILLGIGLTVALVGLVRFGMTEVQHAVARKELENRYQEETKEYETLQHDLHGMPTDSEMAAWLDYDKAHIKTQALKGYGLANRDIIAHVALTEAPPKCRRARVLFGPPRYSKYDVRIFLLTITGVRQFTVRLDLMTGTISNEHRSAFRYDSITSAEVMEVGVRMNGTKRRIVEVHEAENSDAATDDDKPNADKLTLAQAFKLTLNNLQATHVLVENFDEGLIDKLREDSTHLVELARDTSGISAALRILEAVAAEGREWVAQERARRQRRWASYERSQRRMPDAIESGEATATGQKAIDAGSQAPQGRARGDEPAGRRDKPIEPDERGWPTDDAELVQPDGPAGSKGFWF
jgi:hypothetical protein